MATATGSQETAGFLKRPASEWPETFRISTDDIPEPDRLPFFREFLGRAVMRQDIEPLPDYPFRSDTIMRRLPGLLMYWTTPGTTTSPRHIRRTPGLLSDGNDSLLFQWASIPRQVEHLGREVLVGPGDGIVFSCADTRNVLHAFDCRLISLSVPRKALTPLLRDVDAALARPLSGELAAQRLLLAYLELLQRESFTSVPEVRQLAVDHVYDLLAVTLGATGDAAETAKKRGVRAAVLAAIKRSIRENLAHVTLAGITARHRLNARYVQKLFEEEGTTLTEFVLEERLVQARRMLTSPRSSVRKITDIAFDCGFGDISYFHRKYRQRFGATPGETRETVNDKSDSAN